MSNLNRPLLDGVHRHMKEFGYLHSIPSLQSNLANEVRTLRARSGMTQSDLAIALETSQAHVSAIETGKTMLTLEMILRMDTIFRN